ncbi:MAG: coenzyme F420-0:L-glutamate ligase [Gammaproteobacteria bacterium]|jgi:coenzyme F420-0:L-glutamate ligase/coenzyme F420-1:gamma-L-glutamate ligase|nr:coenzyme F420-0:L-glutamate ligase [Gammaproteobacteria bacterium]|tara:strand:- start:1305 stop:2066 length:762 start_codon:yes stop_codon:yes gene_type:complete
MNAIKLIALKNFPLIKPNDDLANIINNSISVNNICIDDNDVIVVAQKIISKSENRYVDLDKVKISEEAIDLASKLNKDKGLIQTIINESNKIISTEKKVVIVEHKLGFININAGIDQSNIPQDKNLALLLPENPTKSAVDLHQELTKFLNKNISIIISDSMTRPFRSGVTNFALASHNIQSLIDLKGEEDMFGNKLKGTEIAAADELASAAGLLMGQSDEGIPVVIIKGFNRSSYQTNNAFDLIVNENDDLYR